MSRATGSEAAVPTIKVMRQNARLFIEPAPPNLLLPAFGAGFAFMIRLSGDQHNPPVRRLSSAYLAEGRQPSSRFPQRNSRSSTLGRATPPETSQTLDH